MKGRNAMKSAKKKHPIIIIFDFDGVLLDSNGSMKAVQVMTMRKDLEWNYDELDKFTPLDLIRRFEMSDSTRSIRTGINMFKKYADLLPSKFHRARYLINLGRIIRRFENKYSDHIPGVLKTIKLLSNSGFLLGICTNSEGSRIPNWLKKWGVEDDFSIITSRNDKPAYGIKPGPRTVLNAIVKIKKKHKLGKIDRDRVYFCGDNPTDVWAAQNARIHSIAVLSGHGFKEELESIGADYVFDSINDLIEIPQIKQEIQ